MYGNMTTTPEERELEYELTLDASTFGHTDRVQQIAEQAAIAALEVYEDDAHGGLPLTAERAASVAITAALRALDDANHLVPEGLNRQRWVVMSSDERPLTIPLTAEELREHMTQNGLGDRDRVDTIRTVISTIPREATRPAPAQSTEAGF